LDAAIEWLVRDSAKRTGIAVTLQVDEIPPLPGEIASHAFRIIQEALTNVTRHSRATLVHVSLRRMTGRILLTVEDNGVGIEPQSLSGLRSMGMVGMRERAVACGGSLMVSGEPGRTSIVVTIPVPAA
jgi:signal transduction histidine kinase